MAYVQLDFLVRFAEQATADASLADKQPYAAALSGDLAWFGDAVTRHYDGDDSQLTVLLPAAFWRRIRASRSSSTPTR